MEAGAPRTLPWALLASVSLHAVAASYLAPIGTTATPRPQPLQAVLMTSARQVAEPPAVPPAATAPAPAVKPVVTRERRVLPAVAPAVAPRPAPKRNEEPQAEAVPAGSGAPHLAATSNESALIVAAASPIEPSSPSPTPISPPSFHAAYLDNPKPAYPLSARRRGLQGETRLGVLVAADGLAQEVKIARSSGSDELDEAAIVAVKHWRFVPARRGDDRVAGWVEVPIAFRLER